MILSDIKSISGPLQPIFPTETRENGLYYCEQNVPIVVSSGKGGGLSIGPIMNLGGPSNLCLEAHPILHVEWRSRCHRKRRNMFYVLWYNILSRISIRLEDCKRLCYVIVQSFPQERERVMQKGKGRLKFLYVPKDIFTS